MTATIVYIDDEPALCRATQMLFELMDLPVPVETFTDAIAACDFIATHDVLLVLCDYRMPQLSGLELLERIQRDIPFYIVSGDLDVARWTDANPRVTGVLQKPYRPERLAEIVLAHLASPTKT